VIDVEEEEGNRFESMIKSFRHFMNSNFAQKKQRKIEPKQQGLKGGW
jgi:hypothetical protein